MAQGSDVRQRARPLPRLGDRGRVGLLAREGRRWVLVAQRLLHHVGDAGGLRRVGRGREPRLVIRRAGALPPSRPGDASCPSLTRGRPRAVHARGSRRGGRDRPSCPRGLRRSRDQRGRRADPGQRDRRRALERGVRLSGSGSRATEPHDRARRDRGSAALRRRAGRGGDGPGRRRGARDRCRPRGPDRGRLRLPRDPASKRRRSCGGSRPALDRRPRRRPRRGPEPDRPSEGRGRVPTERGAPCSNAASPRRRAGPCPDPAQGPKSRSALPTPGIST